jgi:hypothetical protein
VREDVSRFWKDETDPEPRRELLQPLCDRVWLDVRRREEILMLCFLAAAADDGPAARSDVGRSTMVFTTM